MRVARFAHKVVESFDDLPTPGSFRVAYIDVETVSGSPSRGGVLPYRGDRIAGVAMTVDDDPVAYYVPIRHVDPGTLFDDQPRNLDVDGFRRYFADVLGDPSVEWVNHNIKFDAHFFHVDGVPIECQLVDTLTLAKVVDMQSKMGGYGLKPLAKEWLKLDTGEADAVSNKLAEIGSKDFGQVPVELLAEYACADVQLNRMLWKEIQRRRYPDDDRVWTIERRLTSALFRIERRGVRIDDYLFQSKKNEVEDALDRIRREIDGLGDQFERVNVRSSSALRHFVIDVLGLPKIGETGAGSASMSADALREYLEHERVAEDERLSSFFKLVSEYRDRSQFLSLYLHGWVDYIDDRDVLRPNYNQSVRTGRMSSQYPNVQQLSKEAKRLIVPSDGLAFARRDYSQIEYRIITELANDSRVIDAYREDPNTDFHQFVADLCGIDRRPAKNMNFGIAFGMGEGGVVRQLKKHFPTETAESEANTILTRYNSRFPKVGAVARAAKELARRRGWIKTLYGRRRALKFAPYGEGHDETRKAFNTAVQGTAADMMKESIVRMELDEPMPGVEIKAIVHDEVLFEGRPEVIGSEEFREFVDRGMCRPTVSFRVPILVDGRESTRNWAEAD